MIAVAALRLLSLLANVLPAAALYWLARAAGTALLPIAERRRLRARANIQRLQPGWGPSVLDQAVRRLFQETACYYVDLVLLPRCRPDWLFEQRLECEGLEHLEVALHDTRGVVLAGAHLSNPEVAVQALGRFGAQATVIMQPLPNDRFFHHAQRLRRATGQRFVPATMAGVREAIHTLRDGWVVAILSDRDIQGNGLCVPFAKRLARFPTGAVDLALRTNAILLPAVAIRKRNDAFRIIFLEPEPLIRTGERTQEVRANLARLIQRLEPLIQAHADQWRIFESPWRSCREEGWPHGR